MQPPTWTRALDFWVFVPSLDYRCRDDRICFEMRAGVVGGLRIGCLSLSVAREPLMVAIRPRLIQMKYGYA